MELRTKMTTVKTSTSQLKISAVKVGLIIVLSAWFVYTFYWFFRGLSFGGPINIYNRTTTWTFSIGLSFVSEITGTIIPGLRLAAGVAALAAFVMFLRGKSVRSLLRYAILFEALGFILFLPSGLRFIKEPWMFNLWVDAIPYTVGAFIIPIPLLILRSKLASPDRNAQAIKWSFIAGLSYLVFFWLNYAGEWFSAFAQPQVYASSFPGYGLNFVLNYPINMFNFLLTSVGLLILLAYLARLTPQAVRNPTNIDLRKVGATLTVLGAYFIVTILLFAIFGPVGGRSMPYNYMLEHSVDNWAVTLPLLGIPLMLYKQPTAKGPD
jgi:hypothetical protein